MVMGGFIPAPAGSARQDIARLPRLRYVKVTGYTEIGLFRQPKEARRFYWFTNSHPPKPKPR